MASSNVPGDGADEHVHGSLEIDGGTLIVLDRPDRDDGCRVVATGAAVGAAIYLSRDEQRRLALLLIEASQGPPDG